jgi:hypothetical protein
VNHHRTFLITLVISLAARLAAAGQGTITGTEFEGWDTGHYILIAGAIKDVQMERVEGEDRCSAILIPRASLAGIFDVSLHPVFPVQFYVGGPTSSIARPPLDDSFVIAVVRYVPAKETGESGHGVIYSHVCTFMPGQSALVVVNGLDDPKVGQTLKKLQHARAHPDRNPYGNSGDDTAAGKLPKNAK